MKIANDIVVSEKCCRIVTNISMIILKLKPRNGYRHMLKTENRAIETKHNYMSNNTIQMKFKRFLKCHRWFWDCLNISRIK